MVEADAAAMASDSNGANGESIAPGEPPASSEPIAPIRPAVPGEPTLIKSEANTDISCGKTLISAVRYRIEPGENLLVTRVEVLC